MAGNDSYSPQPPVLTGIKGRCPRCGQGRMFRGYIDLMPTCEICGLNSGDGPAVFVIMIAGAVVLGFALWLEFTFEPRFWVHLIVSLPVLIIVCGGLLRVLKGVLIALQYRNKAAEGRADMGPQ